MAFVTKGSSGLTGFAASGVAEIPDGELPGTEPITRHPSGSLLKDLFIRAFPLAQPGDLAPCDLQIPDAGVILPSGFCSPCELWMIPRRHKTASGAPTKGPAVGS